MLGFDENQLRINLSVHLYPVAQLSIGYFCFNSRSQNSRKACILDLLSVRIDLLHMHSLLVRHLGCGLLEVTCLRNLFITTIVCSCLLGS